MVYTINTKDQIMSSIPKGRGLLIAGGILLVIGIAGIGVAVGLLSSPGDFEGNFGDLFPSISFRLMSFSSGQGVCDLALTWKLYFPVSANTL